MFHFRNYLPDLDEIWCCRLALPYLGQIYFSRVLTKKYCAGSSSRIHRFSHKLLKLKQFYVALSVKLVEGLEQLFRMFFELAKCLTKHKEEYCLPVSRFSTICLHLYL